MQRLQRAPAPLSAEALPDLPFPPELEIRSLPLLQRLDALREPGVSQREVDLFLEGLSAILPERESPRVRADLMLDVLEDSRLCALTGTNGTPVGAIALEVLLELGYPYALEITPAMLNRVRGPERSPLPRSVLGGMGVTELTFLLFVALFVPHIDSLGPLERQHVIGGHLALQGSSGKLLDLPPLLAQLFGPAVLSGTSWLFDWRRPRRFFNVLQWLTGAWALWLALTHPLPALVPVGLLTFLGAYCLRPRAQPEPLLPPTPPRQT